METVAVIDFETTGLSPDGGDRATEIAIVLVRGGQVIDRYQSLMNAGLRLSSFIEAYTGITNEMIRAARPAATVMREVSRFLGNHPLAAHNASFDRKFLDAEFGRIRAARRGDFICTMRLSRRIYLHSPDYKLGTLARYLKLPGTGRAHRAAADAEMTAQLLERAQRDLQRQFRLANAGHTVLANLQASRIGAIEQSIRRLRQTMSA